MNDERAEAQLLTLLSTMYGRKDFTLTIRKTDERWEITADDRDHDMSDSGKGASFGLAWQNLGLILSSVITLDEVRTTET